MPVEVAVIAQFEAAAGAVNNPELETDPHEALQVTAWLAAKDCLFSAWRATVEGVIVIGEVTATSADAVEPLPLVAVAVTWQLSGTSGAV